MGHYRLPELDLSTRGSISFWGRIFSGSILSKLERSGSCIEGCGVAPSRCGFAPLDTASTLFRPTRDAVF